MDKKTNKRVQLVKDYKGVFETPAGRRVLYDLMSNHHIMSPTYVDGTTEGTLLREGERRAILRILNILKYDLKTLHERIESNVEND